MDIIISQMNAMPIYEQITQQIKLAMKNGELTAGEPLPSIRQLANDLGVSAITTKRAYAELEAEGLITTVSGRGSFVAERNGEALAHNARVKVETLIGQACETAREAGIPLEELHDMIDTHESGR